MKMKEVTELTGLTERTVRYYMEKGLIAPHGQWRNGREYTEFDETDIARLKAVATLRELGFSVEAIRSMQAEPGLIPQIVAERRQAAESESKIANETERILSGINADDAGSIEELANRYRAYAARPKMIPNPLPLPKADEGNESGMGERCRYVPIGIQDKWNWGAFLLPVWWGIGNRVYQAFACFIPIVGIFMCFYLGKHGNELAWKNKYWEDEEHFRRVQRNWAIAGFAVTAIIIAIAITDRVAMDRANKAAAERKAKLIANVENSEEYIALIYGREKWKGQIGYDESGWMDPFYVDPDGYYRIESDMDIYYDVGDYGYSLPSSPHLERTLVFSNGEEYNIKAKADEKLNITELKIELDKDATERNRQEIESQRDMVTMENEHQFSQLVNNAKLDNVLSGTFKKQGTIDGDDGKKYTYEDYYVPLATTTYRFIFDDSSQLVMFGTQVTGKDMYYANLSFYETSADAFNVIESYQDASKLSASSSQTNNAG